MEKVLIQGYRHLIGDAYPYFEKVPYLGVNPGTKITQIGTLNKNGYITSSCRIFSIDPYMTYMGLFKDEGELYMAFLVPDGYITGWSLFNPPQDVFILMAPILSEEGNELVQSNVNKLTIRIYKAIFKIFKEE